MSKFTSILGFIGKEALKDLPAVIGTVYPPLNGLTGLISTLTLKTQMEMGPGNNEAKKTKVTDEVSLFQPFIVPLIEQITGRNLDDDAFTKLISDIIDISVQWHKLVGSIPTPNQSPALASSVPLPSPVRQTIPIAGQ